MSARPCPEIDHPPNNAAICWWLSVNYALFHQSRPEIQTFLVKGSDVAKIYDTIAKFYKGEGGSKPEVEAARSNELLKEKFNTSDFTLEGSEYQDASQYINKLFNLINIPFHTVTQTPQNFSLYDIDLHRLVVGVKEQTNVVIESTREKYRIETFRVNPTGSLVLFFPRMREAAEGGRNQMNPLEIPVKVLKEIVVPVEGEAMPVRYELDAIVAMRPGHYYSVVKCGDKWQEHGGRGGIDGKHTYESFDELEEYSTRATLLFYTRVGGTSLPAPLPEPPAAIPPPAAAIPPPAAAIPPPAAAIPEPLPPPPVSS
jgi:hypothetical protein